MPKVTTLIFDLSEVLIAGLIGIEKPLAKKLRIPEEIVLPAFGGKLLDELCRGKISEKHYLTTIVEQQEWNIPIQTLETLIRNNLMRRIPGMAEFLQQLKPQCQLVLLSDHALEWVETIHSIHPFLKIFDTQVFSFEIGKIKKEPAAFRSLLTTIDRSPEECLLIDDNPGNIQTANSIGIAGIPFMNAANLTEKLKEYGISVAHDHST
jgi:HAD superfamily hydrolase (TIGR01509 family)